MLNLFAKSWLVDYHINMKQNLFSQRLKEARIKNGLTQEQLAKEVGYNKSAICDWETRGKEPNFDILLKLVKILNVSADYLIGVPNVKK